MQNTEWAQETETTSSIPRIFQPLGWRKRRKLSSPLFMKIVFVTSVLVEKIINCPQIEFQESPLGLKRRCRSQKAYGFFTISTIAPITGIAIVGPFRALLHDMNLPGEIPACSMPTYLYCSYTTYPDTMAALAYATGRHEVGRHARISSSRAAMQP